MSGARNVRKWGVGCQSNVVAYISGRRC